MQGISLNDIEYDDPLASVQVKYEPDDEQSEAIEFEDHPQQIKVEPDFDYDYQDEDENAEFVITELHDPSAYSSGMDELKPYVKSEPSSSSSSSGSAAKYRCNVCGKSFQYLRSYNQHRMVHVLRTDVTTCEICHKELKRTALEYHMKYRHIEARNYQCEVCLNRFKSPGALRHHTATFHPREGYDCDQCERVFKTRDFLRKHKEEEHGEFGGFLFGI